MNLEEIFLIISIVLLYLMFVYLIILCCKAPSLRILQNNHQNIVQESIQLYNLEKENRFLRFSSRYVNDECPICMDKIDEEIYIIPCNHIFHKECLKICCDKNYNCPICRSNILESNQL